jgi:hypothetical protein
LTPKKFIVGEDRCLILCYQPIRLDGSISYEYPDGIEVAAQRKVRPHHTRQIVERHLSDAPSNRFVDDRSHLGSDFPIPQELGVRPAG